MLRRMMSASTNTTLDNLNFTNLTIKSVPIDPESRNFVRTVRGAIFSRVEPTPIINPKVVITSEDALSLLGISNVNTEIARVDFAELMCGNKTLAGSSSHAHCYAGHQFGHFSGQLGDGSNNVPW
jgi:serine/tyrosine/threonine adenylyltransferase